ncbi:hypothetical protein [Segatella copri]|nr:hypothetical protein [Segatella copri]
MAQERKIALLVDAENIPHHRMEQVMKEVRNNYLYLCQKNF